MILKKATHGFGERDEDVCSDKFQLLTMLSSLQVKESYQSNCLFPLIHSSINKFIFVVLRLNYQNAPDYLIIHNSSSFVFFFFKEKPCNLTCVINYLIRFNSLLMAHELKQLGVIHSLNGSFKRNNQLGPHSTPQRPQSLPNTCKAQTVAVAYLH